MTESCIKRRWAICWTGKVTT